MYFPKSQIKTNLYTNGNELIYENSQKDFIGYYYKTSNGKYFSGKTPLSPESEPLILFPDEKIRTNQLSSSNIQITPSSTSIKPPIKRVQYTLPTEYLNSSKANYSTKNILAPNNTKTPPTPEDYKVGQYQRYFLCKINSPLFKETNLTTYERYKNKSKEVQYDLYKPIKFMWVITGSDKDQVARVNYNMLKLTEERYRVKNLISYFKNKLIEYYQ